MRIELSPWQSVTTSVSVASKPTLRRRKRSNSIELPPDKDEAPFAASFVASTKRYRQQKKRKGQSSVLTNKDETIPSIAITAPHRVCVLGRVLPIRGQADDDEHPTLQECSQWQYTSRPDKSASFFQGAVKNGVSDVRLPRIPAVMDARNERVYALQNANSTLCCWNAENANGPDDLEFPAIRVLLKKPALCLRVLPLRKGTVCGTCADGKLFLGRWEADTLRVDYIQGMQQKEQQHVCSFMYSTNVEQDSSSDRKRKAADSEAELLSVFQVFATDDGILMIRHELNLSEENVGGAQDKTSASYCQLSKEGFVLVSKSLLASPLDERTLAVSFRMAPTGSVDGPARYFSSLISLETGQQIRPLCELPQTTKQVVAVSSTLLAIATSNDVLFLDVMHGAPVQTINVSDIVGDCEDWSLVTDTRKGRIAIVHVLDDIVHVSVTKIDSVDHSASQLGLATGLHSQLSVQTPLQRWAEETASNSLIKMSGLTHDHETMNVPRDHAIECLRVCLDSIQDYDNHDSNSKQLLAEYEKAVACLTTPASSSKTLPMDGNGNPQDDAVKRSNLANGIHHKSPGDAPTSQKEDSDTNGHASTELNGVKSPSTAVGSVTSRFLPQRFLDGAMEIMLTVLQLPKDKDDVIELRLKLARVDARLLLSELIKTGKVSARKHFDSPPQTIHDEDETVDFLFCTLRAAKLKNENGQRVLSSVDLMHEMLSHCPDMSERHMVTMIHYMLCRARPDEIAENILGSASIKSHRPFRLLAKEFLEVRAAIGKHMEASPDSPELGSLQNKEDKLSNKLLVAGISVLVLRMVQYSQCNETLLRNALATGLATKDEVSILARVLADMLSNRDIAVGGKRAVYTATVSTWISALCEACREELLSTDESDGPTSMDHIRRCIEASVTQTETAVSLYQVLEQVGSARSSSHLGSATHMAVESSAKAETSAPPPYSIERLVF